MGRQSHQERSASGGRRRGKAEINEAETLRQKDWGSEVAWKVPKLALDTEGVSLLSRG